LGWPYGDRMRDPQEPDSWGFLAVWRRSCHRGGFPSVNATRCHQVSCAVAHEPDCEIARERSGFEAE